MPTGYTYELLKKKQTFPQFAMSCARAFGAIIEMRDDPMDAEIPDEFKPSDYHAKAKQKDERELVRLKKMTPKQRRAFGAKLKAKHEACSVKSLRELREQNAIFAAMRNEALSWNPPTEDHNGLRKFIVEQLDTSMDDERWQKESIVDAVMKSPMEFYRERVEELQKSVQYHAKYYVEDAERTATRNEWIKALRASLS